MLTGINKKSDWSDVCELYGYVKQIQWILYIWQDEWISVDDDDDEQIPILEQDMIGVRSGVSEFLADAKYPSQKISFSISPSVGRCCEKKYAKQSQLECKTARGGFSRPQQEQEARSAARWFG